MEDLPIELTRGNVGEVKIVLAAVAALLAFHQGGLTAAG